MATTKWALDPSHSEVHFKVKHMVISTVSGSFDVKDASAETEGEDFSTASFRFTADVNSINTKNADRDNHLKSVDFFDAENHPNLKFTSTSGIKGDKIEGELEIRGVKKPIELTVDFGGVIVDPWGVTRVGLEATGKINRKDFGLTWSATTEAGGLVVSDEVKLNINLEFVKQ